MQSDSGRKPSCDPERRSVQARATHADADAHPTTRTHLEPAPTDVKRRRARSRTAAACPERASLLLVVLNVLHGKRRGAAAGRAHAHFDLVVGVVGRSPAAGLVPADAVLHVDAAASPGVL